MRFFSILCAMCYSCFIFATSTEITVSGDAKTFDVMLPANPTTGYRWVVDSLDDVHFLKVAEKYLPSKTQSMGAGGQMCFIFKRKDFPHPINKTTILFKYQRPWEKKSVDSREVIVHFYSKK